MSTIVTAQRARTAALIAAAFSALACSEGTPLTAPAQSAPAASAQRIPAQAAPAIIGISGPRFGGYALASGRFTDSLPSSLSK